MAVYALGDRVPDSFLGVDAFFVLSGYLITAGLLVEWAGSGSVSYVNFYRNRALRLFPALLVFLVLAVPATWLWRYW